MPSYQYACRDCGTGFERKLRMSQSDEVQECPSCGSHETRKRIGLFAVGGGSRPQAQTVRPASSPFS